MRPEKVTNPIKEARKRAGLTQKKLCEILESPRRTVENWDMGKTIPPHWAEKLLLEKLEQIAKEREKQV